MYIKTVLTYIGAAWGDLISPSCWKKIETVHNNARRVIFRVPLYVRNDVLWRSLDVKYIQETIIISAHTIFHHITTSSHSHLINLELTNTMADWKRTRPARLLDQ